jgi:Uncharacterized protein conserved in archaea
LDYHANPGKQVAIEANGTTYHRHAIATHFVEVGESYVELVQRYVLPYHIEGDFLSISEKVISLCQKRIVTLEETEPGWLAKFLSGFASETDAGIGVRAPRKMQFAINICGPWKVLWAAFRAGIDKLRGIRGTFYEITGPEVAGLDGFYPDNFEVYGTFGIRLPEHPVKVCDEIHAATGIPTMIVDANDFAIDLLGAGQALSHMTSAQLAATIGDNPAGQSTELTPFILIREVK